MILMASECLFLAYNEIPTTACIQGIQKEGGMQVRGKKRYSMAVEGLFSKPLRVFFEPFQPLAQGGAGDA